MLQRFVHIGAPHANDEACADVHCSACGRDGPRYWAAVCAECGHAWRWGWMLSLHDARLTWRLGKPLGAWDVRSPWWQRLRIRRPAKVWACPCCSHDL